MLNSINYSQTTEPRVKAGLLPALVGVLICSLGLVLWTMLEKQEEANLKTKITTEATILAAHLEDDLRHRIPSLQRMKERWEYRGGIPQAEFINDARAYLSDIPGFQALEWVDRSYQVRWVVPPEGNEKALNLNLASENRRRIALENAKIRRSTTVTSPIDLVQGGKGFLIYFPIYVHEEFNGFIVAVFRMQEWLDYVFNIHKTSELSENFKISVFFDRVPVYQQTDRKERRRPDLSAVVKTGLLDHTLLIRVKPTEAFIRHSKTALPEMTALFGLLLSILVAIIVYLLQNAVIEAWRTHEAKTALENEVLKHQQTEEELQYTLSRLDLATKAGGIGVWTWDLLTDILTWNERMYDLYDIPPDAIPTYNTWLTALFPDDAENVRLLLKKAVEGKASFNTEFRINQSNGGIRHLGAAARVERDHDGKPRRVTGINWDITERKTTEETLRKSEGQVRLLLNSTAEAIYGIDLQGNCTFVNRSFLNILGFANPDKLLGMNMHNLIHHSQPDGTSNNITECSIYQAYREGIGIYRDDEYFWKADGTPIPVEYWSYPQVVNGEITGAVVTFNDITERKQAAETLATERRRLSDILEGTNVGTWEWNIQTGETIINQHWAEIIGYTLEELAPVSIQTWVKFTHPDDYKASAVILERHFRKETEYYEAEVRMRHKNGDWIWVLDRGKVSTWTADGKPLLMSGTHQDINERKLAEEKVRHLASYDVLTDLPSLRLAKDRLAMALNLARRHKKKVAVMFIDLDGFKAVNDTYGHDAGDYTLKEVGQRLLASTRKTDTVARVGGDEFLIVATELHSPENAGKIAEKVLKLLSEPITFGDKHARVGASIGIVLYPDGGDDMDGLIKQADEAMYRVKNSGKNGYCFANAVKLT